MVESNITDDDFKVTKTVDENDLIYDRVYTKQDTCWNLLKLPMIVKYRQTYKSKFVQDAIESNNECKNTDKVESLQIIETTQIKIVEKMVTKIGLNL